MKKISFIYIAFLISFLIPIKLYAKNIVTKVGYTNSGKIYIQAKNKIKYKSFTLQNPNRIVVDIYYARLGFNAIAKYFPSVNNVRSSTDSKKLRLVFDLKNKPIKFSSELEGGNKILISYNKNGKKILKTASVQRKPPKKPVIMIDAGHGGKDPGAIGKYLRTKEKVITLSYAKLLKKELDKSGKYKVYLTRSTDKFIKLRNRVKKARKIKADLFISLHANSSTNTKAKGFSIYTLSEKASDKEAAKLAKIENSADGIGRVKFRANKDIMGTLIDLSQRSSMNYSSKFANLAIKSIKKEKISTISNTHRFAGFAVLTAPDMVSILIELGYISNRKEEKDLNSYRHKKRVVRGLKAAIDSYFKFKN